MNRIPTHGESLQSFVPEPTGVSTEINGQRRSVSWGAVARNRWIILACTIAVVVTSAVLTHHSLPVYEGATTLRIELKESNLPEAVRTPASESRLPTEMEELRSRALTEDVVKELQLQLTLVDPQVRRRSDLLREVRVSDSAMAAEYRLLRQPGGGVALLDDSAGIRQEFASGERIEFGGFSFVLAPAALRYSTIRFSIGLPTAVALQVARRMSVTQPSRDVNIVKVSYRSPDQELAWWVPQALVSHYMAQRQELQNLEMRRSIDFLRQQIATISTQLAESEGKPESYRERSNVINPEAERQPKVLEGVYIMLQSRLKEAELAAAARDPSVRIVDAAIPPIRPVSPKPVVNTLAALVCGLLLGLATAFTREYMDRAIRTRMDVRGSTGLPVLGLIPRIPGKGDEVALIAKPKGHRHHRHPAPPLIVQVEKPAAPIGMALSISTKAGGIAEAYGILQTNIAFCRDDAPARTLVFTSPFSGDGKTTTVVNLGLSIAQRGIRVLLIDADVRRGVLHSVFRGAREPGLSEVLKGTSSFESARRTASVGQTGTLYYLTTGKLSPDDEGLVASDAMRNLLARVREEYDVIIVDTPPVNIITDAAVLAANADGVVLVARVGVTAAPALSYAVEQLRHVRAHVLGVVLNGIDLQHDAVYDSAYKYFRDYEYSTTDH